ncbi:SCO3374 family protein [Streptomyces albipurpureus]|uniref:SCO3374 family protein n=1 Tax=Streptomyces albipurpureus TaxID=2897419 RepID=A0ABT0V050_9ACTN|nr:SCO3374 family protein [Streptomyces sp. CWNU-1]MCM2394052.1 SCO3374 family protein [Streptomyces sp. CWNU-1]
MPYTVPSPRTSPEDATLRQREKKARWVRWYETELGWAVTADSGNTEVTAQPNTSGDGASLNLPAVWLRTGVRFDVLEFPAEVGAAVLGQSRISGPVALAGPRRDRMRLLVAAGSAEELPGLLDWLEWGGITLDLTAMGAGGEMVAPPPPGWPGSREAAVWLRPPVPGCEVEPTLPALAPWGRGIGTGRGHGPDLVRLLDVVASECHRIRLLGTNIRTTAGTSA